MIEIDGSYGEGGGQIVRTALSLSCLFKKPFRIFNIRKNRKKPGLMPQHLTCVRAAQQITGADVSGDFAGSTEMVFSPGDVKAGSFLFDIGTAGSTSLVLQTLIPALAFASRKTTVLLTGGTHVPFSPSFHYLSKVFACFLSKAGIRIQLAIESYGFYPRGGGRISVEILPAGKILPVQLMERGGPGRLAVYSGVGNLPISIAERQKNSLLSRLQPLFNDFKYTPAFELLAAGSPGQGTFIYLHAPFDYSVAGFTALGARGKKAEAVGEEAAEEFIRYVTSKAALDPHMADQIVIYLSLCNEESSFTVSTVTNHLITNLWAISLFHKIRYSVDGEIGEKGMVTLSGI